MTHEQLKTYESQLKPCPFCGAKGKVVHCIIYDGGFVTCSNPMCEVKASTKFSGTPEEAIKAWNTRSEEFVMDFSRIESAESFNLKKVLEDIRAEIKEKVKSVEGGNAYHVANGLNMALEIIDKHIGGKDK